MQDRFKKIHLNPIGQPAATAQMVVVLGSGVASYMTGRTIGADGGMTDYPDFAEGG